MRSFGGKKYCRGSNIFLSNHLNSIMIKGDWEIRINNTANESYCLWISRCDSICGSFSHKRTSHVYEKRLYKQGSSALFRVLLSMNTVMWFAKARLEKSIHIVHNFSRRFRPVYGKLFFFFFSYPVISWCTTLADILKSRRAQ